jgi:hypothetical protein
VVPFSNILNRGREDERFLGNYNGLEISQNYSGKYKFTSES